MKLLLSLLLLMLFTACGKKLTDTKGPDAGYFTVEDELIHLINDHRSRLDLKPLHFHTVIARVAQSHSKDMAMRRRPFSSYGLPTRCKAIFNELGQGSECDENVSMGQQLTAKELFSSWVTSPEQRLTIEGNFTHTGMGMSENSNGVQYWTLIVINIP